MKHGYICILAAILLLCVSVAGAHAAAEDVNLCKETINTSLKSIIDKKLESAKIQFSTDLSPHRLIDESIDLLRQAYLESEGMCQGLELCSEYNLDTREKIELMLYCNRAKSERISLLKNTVRSQLLQNSRQKEAVKLIESYQKINMKMETLSEQFIRFTQYIGKFNSALGSLITQTCQL